MEPVTPKLELQYNTRLHLQFVLVHFKCVKTGVCSGHDTIRCVNLYILHMVKHRTALLFPNLIGLWAGEASCQRSTTRRQRSSKRRATVGQEGFQVAGEQASVKD